MTADQIFIVAMLGAIAGYFIAKFISYVLSDSSSDSSLKTRVRKLEDKFRYPSIELGMDSFKSWVRDEAQRFYMESSFSGRDSAVRREIAELQQLAIDLGYTYQKGGRWVKAKKARK